LSIVLSEIKAWEEDERVNYPDDEVLESLDRIRDALVSPMRGITSEVQGLAPSVWNDEYQAKALTLAAEVRDRRHANYAPSYQEKLLLADALMHAVVSAAGMPPASHESEPTDRAREERVAKAIFEAVEQDPFYSWEMLSADNPDRFDCLKQARAALAALIYPAPANARERAGERAAGGDRRMRAMRSAQLV